MRRARHRDKFIPSPSGGERAVLTQVAGLGRRQEGQDGRGSGREGARTVVWLIAAPEVFLADSKEWQTISALSPGLHHGAGELLCRGLGAWAYQGECLPLPRAHSWDKDPGHALSRGQEGNTHHPHLNPYLP